MRSVRLPLRSPVLLVAAVAALASGGMPQAQVIMGLPEESAEAVAKQPASEAVRSAMAAVRKLVLDVHTLITHRRFAPEQARRFATEVKRHVGVLEADPAGAALKDIAQPLGEGAAQIAGPVTVTSQLDGLDKIETALARYPQVFDDPDWKPLR